MSKHPTYWIVSTCLLSVVCVSEVSAITATPLTTVGYYCSLDNTTGLCENGERCVDGVCKGNCSLGNPTGFCKNGEQCVDGICKGKCSPSSKDGYCPSGRLSYNTRCVDGQCKDACSPYFKDGYCDDDIFGERRCMRGRCQGGCSASYKDGFCDSVASWLQRKCIDGVCQEKCSTFHKTGYCESYLQRMECVDGECKERCSFLERNGYCEPGLLFNAERKCVDGMCRERCSILEKNGFCDSVIFSSTVKCIDGVCREMCSPFQRSGYCDSPFGNLKCINGICQSSDYSDTFDSWDTNMKALVIVGTIVLVLFLTACKQWCKPRCRTTSSDAEEPSRPSLTLTLPTHNPHGQAMYTPFETQVQSRQGNRTGINSGRESPAPSYQSIIDKEDPPPSYESLQTRKPEGHS